MPYALARVTGTTLGVESVNQIAAFHAQVFKILCQVIAFHNHDIFEGGRISQKEFAERVIFENSLKLYERFLKNFEFWKVEFSLLNLTFRLKLKGIKVPLYSWLQLGSLVLE